MHKTSIVSVMQNTPEAYLRLHEFASRHSLNIRDELLLNGTYCVYSQDMERRYAYCFTWDASRPSILWVMLNPGTGDAENRPRRTLDRCKDWSRHWGYGGLLIGNAFSARAKSAKYLAKMTEPNDPHNDEALMLLARMAEETIVAWGNGGARMNRSKSLRELFGQAKCLGLTKFGEPRHPLYVLSDIVPIEWNTN